MAAGGAAPDELAGRFHRRHEERLGYRMDSEPVEVVAVRVVATVAVDCPLPDEAAATGEDPVVERRRACIDGAWAEVDVLDRNRMGAGSEVEGAAIVAFDETTVVVGHGWGGEIDATGTLVLRHADDPGEADRGGAATDR